MNFFKQFLTNPKATGAIASSSRRLARLIAETANLPSRTCVVELGPGTGVFTREILARLPEGAVFFCLEINPCFAAETRAACPEAVVYEASAKDIRRYLTEHGRTTCDCIICGLPWAAFDADLQEALMGEVCDALEPGGAFLTFAYLQGLILPAGKRFKKLLQGKFRTVARTRTVWRNLPPALVYHCTK